MNIENFKISNNNFNGISWLALCSRLSRFRHSTRCQYNIKEDITKSEQYIPNIRQLQLASYYKDLF